MRDRLLMSRAAFGLSAFACLVGSAAFGLFDGPWQTCILVRGLTPSECASWVQAWGTIAAIAAAGFGVWYQVFRTERMRREEQFSASASYAKACYLVARDSAAALAYIARRLRESVNGELALRTDRLEDLQSTCRSLVTKDLPPKVLDRMLRVQTELAYSVMALKQLQRRPSVSKVRAESAEKRAQAVRGIERDLGSYDMLYGWLAENELRWPAAPEEEHGEMEMHGERGEN